MAKRKTPPLPTDGELEILAVLWENGPLTVREVNNILNKKRRTGYTTTLKLMQIMTQKGTLVRDLSKRPQVYEPRFAKDVTQQQFIENLVNKAFDGSAGDAMESLLSLKSTGNGDIERIQKVLRERTQAR